MARKPNFAAQEDVIAESVSVRLAAFAKNHSNLLFTQFAFDCNPDYGELLLCLDTPSSTTEYVLENQANKTEQRFARHSYDDELSLRYAQHEVAALHNFPLVPYNNSCGNFSHQGFDEISLAGWEDFQMSDEYPGEIEGTDEDYLQSVSAVFLFRVARKLIDRAAFDCLHRTSPFLVSVGFHDTTHFIAGITDWPNNNG